jgi:glycosyltransferase involved in cell wall biosynthesis
MSPSITLLIPTAFSALRERTLDRALASCVAQTGPFRLVVRLVGNGPNASKPALRELAAHYGAELIATETPGLPTALALARRSVQTDFFCFLDDDDELLPDALRLRSCPMLEDDTIDAVVTNGFNHRDGCDHLRVTEGMAVQRGPLRALLAENWLASSGGLFRTSSIGPDFFDERIKYFEWTMLAFHLALRSRILFLDMPSYRIYDSPASLSKTPASREAAIGFLQHLMSYDIPEDVRQGLRRKLAAALHDQSDFQLKGGNTCRAWSYHLKSLLLPGGLRYLLYTRKLLATSLGLALPGRKS